jgi:CubicO group peptidase (beta-lactamase class C family)
MVVAIVEFKLLGTVIMKSYIRIIFVLAASLMATHALSQDISGWSDRTVCRLVASDGGAAYLEEASSRGLDCKAPTKAKPTKPKSKSSSGIDTYGGSGYILENESPNFESLRWSLYRKLHYRPLQGLRFYSVQASNPFNFEFDLREDTFIKQQMQTTPLLSYLLFEDGKIVIDEITPKDRFGDMFTEKTIYHSMSMGKSMTSYIAGHAICEGRIKSVDSRLDWPILQNTLYHNQKLINLLNMASGDQAYSQNDESGLSIQSRMATEFKGSKKSNTQYHYTNMNTNLVLSYLLFKYGDEGFKALFDDIFQKKVGIKNEVLLNKTNNAFKHENSLGHQFFITRYDYLRIAKAMLDDWQNDTCVGQYLKTIHERRIPKNGTQGTKGRVGLPLSYGGFFHTGYKGMENRPVMGMDGNGGQTILIDFERGRIVVTQAVFDNMRFPDKASYNWKKIAYETIKYGKPASKAKAKKPTEAVINPQQLILHNEARRQSDRKSKAYWDDYYDRIFFGASADGSTMFSEDFENLDQRDLRVGDENHKWHIKQDNDGNSVYCNNVTNGWTHFIFGSANWSDYSISYRMKFSAGKGGTAETHIRKTHGSDYRARIGSYGGVEIQFAGNADIFPDNISTGYVSTKTGEWLDIQLTASGDNIKYLVDGEVVASAKDDRVKKGAGMIAVSANAEVCIDDIAVQKI